MSTKGKFIVLEGGEGAGKSTIAAFLKQALTGKNCLFTRAAGSSIGEKVRALLVSDKAQTLSPASRFFLWWGAHADHVSAIVEPALARGVSVISDRFDASIFAYQVLGEKAGYLEKLFWHIRSECIKNVQPDMYIFLDVAPQTGLERVRKARKTLDHFEKRPRSFHERVREGYAEFFKKVPHVVVDANRPVEKVQEEVLGHIARVLAQ